MAEAQDIRRLSREELEAMAAQDAAPQKPARDVRTLSPSELQKLAAGDDGEHDRFWSMSTAKKLGAGAQDFGKDYLTDFAPNQASALSEGVLKLYMLPNDMINIGSQLLTDKDLVTGSPQAIAAGRRAGLLYHSPSQSRVKKFFRDAADIAGQSAGGAAALTGFANMLKAGKYIPQVVSQARTVWQKMMTEAANNPELFKTELKAGVGAGVGSATLKQMWPDAPTWVDLLAQVAGGAIGYPGRGAPSLTSQAGREERVVETLGDLNKSQPAFDAQGNRISDPVAGLASGMELGQQGLRNPDGTLRVENFSPTTAQVAQTQQVLPDGSTAVTRNLGSSEKATLGGSPELQGKLEGQARAINTGTEGAFQADPNATLPYDVTPSEAGRQIREDLADKKVIQQKTTSDAYDQVDQAAVQPVHDLFDRVAELMASRTEASNRPKDMPDEAQALLDTWRPSWPDDMIVNGQPMSYDDFVRLRGQAVISKDPAALQQTQVLLDRLAPEKNLGLLKEWRTRIMGEAEATPPPTGFLKRRIQRVREGLESALDSFGNKPGDEGAKFRGASAEARKLKEIFESGGVSDVLDKEWGRYVKPDSDVPGVFTAAGRQPESWKELVAAAGDPAKATQAARRVIQQRFKSQTANKEMLPEGDTVPSSFKMEGFLKNPDNLELLTHAYGPEHVARLRELAEAARVRESILSSPGVGGSNTQDKLRALERLQGGRELDRMFASLTLRLGFAARAGRKAVQMAYGRINEAMDQMYRDALIDPDYLQGLLGKTMDAQARRSRTRYHSYLTGMPHEELDDLEKKNIGHAAGGAVAMDDLLEADMQSRQHAAPFLKGYAVGGKVAKAVAGKWFSGLEKAIENAPDDLSKTVTEWYDWLRGKPGVKKEELDHVWPMINETIGPREAPVLKSDLLDIARLQGSQTDLPEFQSGQTITEEDLAHDKVESPLQMFNHVLRSRPESPMQFEIGVGPNRSVYFDPQQPNDYQVERLSTSSPLRSLAQAFNTQHQAKYGQDSNVRLKGGSDYRETVIGSPLAQPMSIDQGHFGSVPGVGQSQIAWALHHTRREPDLEGSVQPEELEGFRTAGEHQQAGLPAPRDGVNEGDLPDQNAHEHQPIPHGPIDYTRQEIEHAVANHDVEFDRQDNDAAAMPTFGGEGDHDIAIHNPYWDEMGAQLAPEEAYQYWVDAGLTPDQATNMFQRFHQHYGHGDTPGLTPNQQIVQQVGGNLDPPRSLAQLDRQFRRVIRDEIGATTPEEENMFIRDLAIQHPSAVMAYNEMTGMGRTHFDRLIQEVRNHPDAAGAPGAAPRQEVLPPPAKPKSFVNKGAKVTFIDEAQSYRHQKGIRRGYKGDRQTAVLAARNNAIDALAKQGVTPPAWNPRDQRATNYTSEGFAFDRKLGDLLGPEHPASKALKQAYDQQEGDTPQGPYKKSWPLLILRRMLWQAAQDDSDWLAWNSAEAVQAHGAKPDIAKGVYDDRLPTAAKDEVKRLGLDKGAFRQIEVGPKKEIDRSVRDWPEELRQVVHTIAHGEIAEPEGLEDLEKITRNEQHMTKVQKFIFNNQGNHRANEWLKSARSFNQIMTQLDEADSSADSDEYDRLLQEVSNLSGEVSVPIEEAAKDVNLLQKKSKAWGIKLTPEVKAQIIREGFPKMMLATGVSTAALSAFMKENGLDESGETSQE